MTQHNPRPAKQKPSEKRRARQEADHQEHQHRFSPVVGRTPGQRRYIAALKSSATTVVIGPAGTGKTFCAASYGAQLYVAGAIKRFILVRPAVEAGEEKHGFLPGDINKKLAPWAEPVLAVLRRRLGDAKVAAMILSGDIKVEPFTYMRGLSWDDAFIMLDEAQNTTVAQMKLFTTRVGDNCRVVIDGDLRQSDLSDQGYVNGLEAVVDIIADRRMDDTTVIRLHTSDIVRSEHCKRWVEAWEDYDLVDTQGERVADVMCGDGAAGD